MKNKKNISSVFCQVVICLFLCYSGYAQPIVIPREVYNIDQDHITGREMKALLTQYRQAQALTQTNTRKYEEICDPAGGASTRNVDSLSVFPYEISGVGGSITLREYLFYRKDYNVPHRCDTLTKDGNDAGLYEAYTAGWFGNSSLIVAIIDTGLTPDLGFPEERLWVNTGEIPDNGLDDDGNGFIDDFQGYSFVDSTGSKDVLVNEDNRYHGSHMANVIGASGDEEYFDDNSWGFGPDQHCKIMNLKVNHGAGIVSISALAQAIKFAADNKARIINISISDPAYKPTSWDDLSISYDSALTASMSYAWKKGCLLICGVGNINPSIDFNLQKSHYNKIANHPATIGVGSIHNHVMAFYEGISYSGRKNDLVSFAYVMGSGAIMAGTSSSTAFVSGLIALYWGANMHLTNVEVKKAVLEAVRDQIFDVGNTENLIAIVDDGRKYEILEEGQEPSQSYFHTKNDVPDRDDFYGFGFLSLAELVNGVRYREVTIDPKTGAADDYIRPVEVLEEDYDLLSIPFIPLPLAVNLLIDQSGIYPNPVGDYLTVERSNHEPGSLVIYDLAGHQVKETKNTKVYVGDLKPGLYVVKVKTNKTESQTKIIKL